MKKTILVLTLSLSAFIPLHSQSHYTTKTTMIQSPIHDAIQLFYASNGMTVYFEPILGGAKYNIIDIKNEVKTVLNMPANNSDSDASPVFDDDGNVVPGGSPDDGEAALEGLMRTTLNEKIVVTTRVADSKEIILKILRRNAQLSSTASVSELADHYKDNPYLQSLFNGTTSLNISTPDIDSFIDITSITSLSTEGGAGVFSLNAFAEGFSDFLIQRANEEFKVTVFQRLQNLMGEIPELPILFPETNELLGEIEAYNYNIALNAMKTKFSTDMSQLPANAVNLANLSKYQDMLNTYPGLTVFFLGLQTASGLDKGTPAPALIQQIYLSPYVSNSKINTTINSVLKFSGLMSLALRDVAEWNSENADDKNWVNLETVYKTPGLDKTEMLNLLFGLLYEITPEINFSPTEKDASKIITFKKILKNNHGKITDLEDFIQKASNSIKNIQAEISTISDKIAAARNSGTTTPNFTDSFGSNSNNSVGSGTTASNTGGGVDLTIYDNYINIVDHVLNIAISGLEKFDGTKNQTALINKLNAIDTFYIPLSKYIVTIASDIKLKQYNAAIYDFGIALKKVLQRIDTTNTLNWNKSQKRKFKKFLYCFYEYGNLIATIALAESGTEVNAALQATALPTGSSRIKKHADFNIAINSYLGWYLRPDESSDDSLNLGDLQTGFTRRSGITAPVGIAVSGGLGKLGSISVFGGIIDLGAVVGYQLDSTKAVPDLQWANLFSPSVQLVYGLPFNIPFSIGGGWQWTPKILGIDDEKKFDRNANLFIAVDIPLYNIFNVKKVTTKPVFTK